MNDPIRSTLPPAREGGEAAAPHADADGAAAPHADADEAAAPHADAGRAAVPHAAGQAAAPNTEAGLRAARQGADGPSRRSARGRWVLWVLIATSLAPIVASYVAYYVTPPADRTNYGELIEPQRPVPTLGAVLLKAGEPSAESIEAENRRVVPAMPEDALDPLRALRGRWILLAVGSGGCDTACAERLFFARQTHASLGRERGRVARVLVLTDDATLPKALAEAHPDLTVVRIAADRIAALLPVPAGASRPSDFLYLIDPLHNLMMRFPTDPDPAGVRRDLQKLLRASRIG